MSLPSWIQNYHKDIQRYGPLPPPWRAVSVQGNLAYETQKPVRFGDQETVLRRSFHPLSSKGRAEHLPVYIHKDNRANFPGIAQVITPYDGNLYEWIPCSSPLHAFTLAIKEDFAMDAKKEAETKQHLVQAQGLKLTAGMYHPEDRSLLVPQYEKEMAYVLRQQYNRNLVVVAPRVSKPDHWDYIWNTTPTIPVLARYSTGNQADRKPMLLGWLPAYGKVWAREGHWFVIKPYGGHQKTWDLLWNTYVHNFELLENLSLTYSSPTWDKSFSNCGWPTGDLDFAAFAWVMVMTQRTILLGRQIPDEQLGEWVVQYGQHLRKAGVDSSTYRDMRSKIKFVFDDKVRSYRGPPVTFTELSAQIMRYGKQTEPKLFAQQWDTAIEKWYRFKWQKNISGGGKAHEEVIPFLQDIASMSTTGRRR